MINKLRRIISTSKTSNNFLVLVIMYFAIGIFGLLMNRLIGEISDTVINSNYNQATVFLIYYGILSCFFILISYLSTHYSNKTDHFMRRELKGTTLKFLLDANSRDRSQFDQGDLIGRFNNDISSMSSALMMTSSLVKSLMILILYAMGIALIDLRLFLLFIIPLPLVALIQTYCAKKSSSYITPWKESMGDTYNLAQDILNNNLTIRSYSLQGVVKTWTDKALFKNLKTATSGISKLYMLQIPSVIIAMSSIILIGGFGSLWIYQGDLSIASVISTLTLVLMANEEFNNILNMLNNIPHLLVSTDRIFPLWDLEEEEFGSLTVGRKDAPLIEFENVSFSYDKASSNPTLSNISFKIYEGQHFGVMGVSGSGKSTLMKLLLGSYSPDSGFIYFKGIKVQDWDKEALRNSISSVSQRSYIFDDSIRNNISLHNKKASDETIIKLLEDLNFDMSSTSALNLDTLCGEKGSNLSGGQRQRISIARSFLKNSDILVMDEATSALDTLSESAIQAFMKKYSHEKTQFLIAHRVNTLSHCHTIIVMENGKIIESGSPQELYKSKGKYYEAMNTLGETHEKQ